MKVCTKCRQAKPPTEFYKDNQKADRLTSSCRACCRVAQEIWLSANREKHRQINRASYSVHKAKRLAYMKLYRKRHPEQDKAVAKAWRKANRVADLRLLHAYRARRRNAFVEHVNLDVLFQRDGGKCRICSLSVRWEDASIDHILPLSKGGEHSYRNVQLAHVRCNARKGARGIGQLRLVG